MSLQRRLLAVMALLLAAGLLVADLATYASVRSFLYGRADATLASSESVAYDYLTFSAMHHGRVTLDDLDRRVSPDVYVVLLSPGGKVLIRRPSGPPATPTRPPS